MGRLPDALNEDSSLVSSLPILLNLLIVEADIAKFIHIRGDYGRVENVHLSIVQNHDSLVFLEFEIIQMVVVNIKLMAEIRCVTLLDLDERVASHEVGALVPVRVRVSVVAGASMVTWLIEPHQGIAVLILGQWALGVLLVPLDHVVPLARVGLHPVAHELDA